MRRIAFHARNLIGAFWNWWLADLYYLRKEMRRLEELEQTREAGR